MRHIHKLFLLTTIVMLMAASVSAQDGRINRGNVLDIAIYCANGGIEIWHITDQGQGQQALTATQSQINAALSAAQGGQAVTVASGQYGVTLTALPGIRLRASQRFSGRSAYDYDFNGDTCGPVNLSQVNAASGNFPDGLLVGGNAAPAADASAPVGTTQNQLYTIQQGDTLFRIASRFNVTVGEIIAANNFANPDRIFPGQQIVIPNQVVQEPAPAEGVSNPAEELPPPPPSGNGNLLRDPSFEGQYTNRGRSDFNIPSEWGIQVITEPRQYVWQNTIPYSFPRRDPPIREGGISLNMNRGYATYSAVLFQRVSVPANANLQASAWAWYQTCDPGMLNCNGNGNPVFRVGIDPTGGTNPFAPGVVWSPSIAPQLSWGQTGVSARASGNVVTMFIAASQDAPRAINELFIDDASLVVVP